MEQSGETSQARMEALDLLAARKQHGLTSLEWTEATGTGRPTTASTLSILHEDGLITRLKESRRRGKVYVLHEYVEGREEEPRVANAVKLRERAEQAEATAAEVERQYSALLSAVKATSPQAQQEVHAELIKILTPSRT
jgi:hypothetical protein